MKNGVPSDFPVDVDRWLMSQSVGLMEPEQEGAFFRLLCLAWASADCTLPADEEQLAKLSRLGKRWKKFGPVVLRCFEPVPGKPDRLWNRNQVQTREEQKARMEKANEKCEKMRAAKAAKQDKQMRFEDMPKEPSEAPSKEPAKRSYKEPLQAPLEAPLQALSSSYSDSLLIPRGGGSPQTEDVKGPSGGVPPRPAAPPKGEGRAAFRPLPLPVPEKLFRRELEGLEADARAMIQRIEADPLNVDRALKPEVAAGIARLEGLKPEDKPGNWREILAHRLAAEENYTRTLKPEAAAVAALWRARIEELKLAKAGAFSA